MLKHQLKNRMVLQKSKEIHIPLYEKRNSNNFTTKQIPVQKKKNRNFFKMVLFEEWRLQFITKTWYTFEKEPESINFLFVHSTSSWNALPQNGLDNLRDLLNYC